MQVVTDVYSLTVIAAQKDVLSIFTFIILGVFPYTLKEVWTINSSGQHVSQQVGIMYMNKSKVILYYINAYVHTSDPAVYIYIYIYIYIL